MMEEISAKQLAAYERNVRNIESLAQHALERYREALDILDATNVVAAGGVEESALKAYALTAASYYVHKATATWSRRQLVIALAHVTSAKYYVETADTTAVIGDDGSLTLEITASGGSFDVELTHESVRDIINGYLEKGFG